MQVLSHGDVKPVDDVAAVGAILLHLPQIFAATGHEYHLLVFLHPLLLHQLRLPTKPRGQCRRDFLASV
jgi:hypothetical protein